MTRGAACILWVKDCEGCRVEGLGRSRVEFGVEELGEEVQGLNFRV
jgi:hypothetical protein